MINKKENNIKNLNPSEMGKKSFEIRKKNLGIKNTKDISKMMSHVRNGKKYSEFIS